ncbi:MAG: hypothetical protein JNK85_15610 [Verrucomicrobiales bacterium]|nr:hypothetical protein [Verrucomicrobiales bacterium]
MKTIEEANEDPALRENLTELCAGLSPRLGTLLNWLYKRPQHSASTRDIVDEFGVGGNASDPKDRERAARDLADRLEEALMEEAQNAQQRHRPYILMLETQRKGAVPMNAYRLVIRANTSFLEKPESEARAKWLITDGHVVRYRFPGMSWAEIPLWVISSSKSSLDAKVIEVDQWTPPNNIQDYPKFRENRWQELLTKRPHLFNNPVWMVCKHSITGDGRLAVYAAKAQYKDYIATTRSLAEVVGAHGETMFDILRNQYHNEGRLPSAPLAVNVGIITKDGEMIIAKQSKDSHVDPEGWVATVSGTMDPITEIVGIDDQLPSPKLTARNETVEEIGVQLRINELSWVAYALGLKFGHPALIAEAVTPFSYDEIKEAFNDRTDRREVEAIDRVKLTPENVAKVLRRADRPHRTYFEMALVLALWRRGHAEVLF